MSTAFAASLPLIEQLKEELGKLKTATERIEQDKANAAQNALAAKEAVSAAGKWTVAYDQLVGSLAKQHQASLNEQELLLRTHATDLAHQTADQTARQLDGLKQAATKAQTLIDQLLKTQPPLLAELAAQHQRGIASQQEMLQKQAQAWADSLHQQLQSELKLLRQAIETLQKNTRQQHDEFSAVANQLQVVAGRVTAFAEVMNAARFTSRLESIEKQQQDAAAANTAAFSKLTASQQQHKTELTSAIQHSGQQAAATAQQQHETLKKELAAVKAAQQQTQAEMSAALQAVAEQLTAATRQQRLLQLLLLGGLVALAAVVFFKPFAFN